MAALNARVHAVTADGRVLSGLDSMQAAYSLVGMGWAVLPDYLCAEALASGMLVEVPAFETKALSVDELVEPLDVTAATRNVCHPLVRVVVSRVLPSPL